MNENALCEKFSMPEKWLANKDLRQNARVDARQEGAISIMTAVLLVPLIGLCGLAIDAGLVYNRETEMRNLAQAVALSAAKKLNGTTSGISDAAAAAASTAAMFKYKNRTESVNWSDAALQFSTSPDRAGDWVNAGSASTNSGRMFYVKVDTSKLDGAGSLHPALMPVLSAEFANISVSNSAIAGRTGVEITPLAICAMSTTPAAARNNSASSVELVEYGFRRGISYDLMDLSPAGTTALNFAVDPVAMPGTPGSPADMAAANLAPYVCTGTLRIPGVMGDRIAVQQSFPLSALYTQLNSRFDQYNGSACSPNGGPPDMNIKAYIFSSMPAVIPWMTTAPGGQTAKLAVVGNKRQTVADLPPPGGTASEYGPIWAYAKAVPYTAYTPGVPEPAAGYPTFTTAAWSTLYGGQTVNLYPGGSNTPYKPGAGVNLASPAAAHSPGFRNRRVLNIALLDCTTVPTSSANVLAIGKFFMTVPATSTVLAAEFAGIAPLQRIDGSVGLFQ